MYEHMGRHSCSATSYPLHQLDLLAERPVLNRVEFAPLAAPWSLDKTCNTLAHHQIVIRDECPIRHITILQTNFLNLMVIRGAFFDVTAWHTATLFQKLVDFGVDHRSPV